MRPDEFAAKMRDLRFSTETNAGEYCHERADDLLVQLIRDELPEFGDGLEHYAQMVRWFA